MTRWSELEPDSAMLKALVSADSGGTRQAAISSKSSSDRSQWSNRFADSCAVMVADALRQNGHFNQFEIRPNADGSGKESLTFVAAGSKKQVDVIAATLASGLQVGFSLKGLNFGGAYSFDHNLTGRTYELMDEVSQIHEYQASAFMVGIFFIPLLSTEDKQSGPSSFARTVAHLRARSGRTEVTLPAQFRRCDFAAVGLYAAGDDGEVAERGAVRFLDVRDDPPRRGRPSIESTLSLPQLMERISSLHASDPLSIAWADPEPD